jgi:hypothetical protein
MSDRLWVKIASWHVATFTDRGGALRTRCGLRARVEGTITSGPSGPTRVSRTSLFLPLGEKSCENCARLTLHDEEA